MNLARALAIFSFAGVCLSLAYAASAIFGDRRLPPFSGSILVSAYVLLLVYQVRSRREDKRAIAERIPKRLHQAIGWAWTGFLILEGLVVGTAIYYAEPGMAILTGPGEWWRRAAIRVMLAFFYLNAGIEFWYRSQVRRGGVKGSSSA